ncbi:MAG: M56 family metallopeptidase [Acidimicrobiales bacterium]
MTLLVLLLVGGGVGLLILPAAARPLGRRVAPREWARFCALALAGGAVAVEAAAVLAAAPTVLRAAGVPTLAGACERMLGGLTPGGPVGGWAAAAVAFALPVVAGLGAVRTWEAQRVAWIEPWLGEHRCHGPHRLVILPTDQLLALNVPARRPQIVISEGLAATLAPAELGAVLDHEAAHLAHRHHRYLLLASAVDHSLGWLPLVHRSTGALRVSLERWADEAAAARPGARQSLRDALLRVAHLLATPPAAVAFGGADALIERLDALEAESGRPSVWLHALLYAPGSALGGTALVAIGSWAGTADALLRAAGHCPVV